MRSAVIAMQGQARTLIRAKIHRVHPHQKRSPAIVSLVLVSLCSLFICSRAASAQNEKVVAGNAPVPETRAPSLPVSSGESDIEKLKAVVADQQKRIEQLERVVSDQRKLIEKVLHQPVTPGEAAQPTLQP